MSEEFDDKKNILLWPWKAGRNKSQIKYNSTEFGQEMFL